jgi:phospholipid/cholesterol/gamma-HCH transport system substrate-binding protein
MNKSAPSFGRIAAMVVFALSCFGLLLFLWLAFGGSVPLKPKGYRINASFAEAAQLSTEADVRISGVPVGKVKTIEPDKSTGRSIVTIELEPRYAPLPSDSRAILRQKTLLGETYVELTPGSASAPKVQEGGSLGQAQVSDTVQLDEILRSFDKPTRAAFQTWMQEQAKGIGGYGRDLNDAFGNLAPFAEDTAHIVDILNRQEGAVRSLISNTGVVFDALSERDGQLRSLIRNANRVFAATASRDEQLKEAFMALPTFESESQRTLDRLTAFSRNANPLVTQLRPAARELSPTLRDLGALSPDLKRLFQELGPLIDASREGFPAAEKVLEDSRPLIAQLDPAMRQITPILQFLALYKPTLTTFFANTVGATQASETRDGKKVHYLRTTNPLNAENLAVYPRRVGTNRPNAYAKPDNFNQLRQGMPVFENRHCSNGVPAVTNVPAVPLPPPLDDLISDELLNNIVTYAFGGTQRGGVAVPCRVQGPYNFGGEITQYPHVRAR